MKLFVLAALLFLVLGPLEARGSAVDSFIGSDKKPMFEKPMAGAIAGGLAFANVVLAVENGPDLPLGIAGLGAGLYLGLSDEGEMAVPVAVLVGFVSTYHIIGYAYDLPDGRKLDVALVPRFRSESGLEMAARFRW